LGLELPQELIELKHFEVWPENWPAAELFMRCQTQWRVSDGRRIGLDYGALLAIGSLFAVESLSQVVEDVQVIEHEILSQQEAKR
jgi:Phage related hypothetical protein (DUF1799)